jgi:hypothetical protein
VRELGGEERRMSTASMDIPTRNVLALFVLVLILSIPLYIVSAFIPLDLSGPETLAGFRFRY